jgi:hypothetical protein
MSGIIAQNTLDNSGLVKAPAGGGAWNFIAKQTASASSTISFTSGIDSTYKEYVFTFNNIHPQTDGEDFQFNMSTDGGSNYNVTKTSSFFYSYHSYAIDALAGVDYNGAFDLAQSTSDQVLNNNIGNDNDQSAVGTLHLFNPSSTTFVKHYMARVNSYHSANQSSECYSAGYANTTSAIDAIIFKMNSGNIDAGDICLYGISS